MGLGGISVIVALVAALAGTALVLTKGWHGVFSLDSQDGVQKFHDAPTPRIGGMSLLAGLLAALVVLDDAAAGLLGLVLLCAAPAFFSGLFEDLTKTVTPRLRLLAALLSGALLVATAGVVVPLAAPLVPAWSGTWGIWTIYALGALGMVIGLAGTTNAVNIIDGFHGLAAGSVIIMSLTLAALAALEGDVVLAEVCIVFAAAMAGFLVVNFPRGLLFLGDAGAYLAGFVLGALALLLAARTDVSAFVSILVMAYPVYETLFSMARKIRRPGHSPSRPDGVHLHMLVSRRFARFIAYGLEKPHWKNPITGVLMWPFSLVAACLAFLAQGTNIGGVLGLVIFVLFYARVYRLASLQRASLLQPYARKWGWDESTRYRAAGAPEPDPAAGEG